MANAREKEILRLLNLGHRAIRAREPCRRYQLGSMILQERTLIRMREAGLLKIGFPPGGGSSTYMPTLEGLAAVGELQVGDREAGDKE